ncbi:MAG TPA: VWA domain-containing protein [Vicinamibacterales bacterium]|nr:VWA domain-containing protein [Vicinamibacterales bacterium]
MYPFSSLPENLTAFCAVLRREYGFRVGPRQIHDAARALRVTSIADERSVRNALRAVLSGSVADVEAFDRAFQAFFYPGATSPKGEERPSNRFRRDAHARSRESRGAAAIEREALPDSPADTGTGRAEVISVGEEQDEAAGTLLRSSYSPVETEGEPPDLGPVDRMWREAAAALVRRVEAALSRRFRPALRGPRFDLRRTLRSSLHTGGEPVLARWRARPRLRPRFVVIVDGSRSMAAYAQPALRIAVAIASVTTGVEVFVFSTALERITGSVRSAAAGGRRRLPELHHAWGGGTGIGVCLRDFIHRHGERLLGRDTVVIVASDGLDVGRVDILRQAMAHLQRRSAAIVWLNPLLATPGYQPTALGMRAARPFVSTFAWAGTAGELVRLAHSVRVRS